MKYVGQLRASVWVRFAVAIRVRDKVSTTHDRMCSATYRVCNCNAIYIQYQITYCAIGKSIYILITISRWPMHKMISQSIAYLC